MAQDPFDSKTIYLGSQFVHKSTDKGASWQMISTDLTTNDSVKIKAFQNTMMRVRYSSIPVVVAPHNLALGGACEMSLHADKVIAAAETYTGLVEVGIGVIPGGAGTKEFVLRAADEMHDGEVDTLTLQNRFLTIATAKVATSAHEAYDLGIYRKGRDLVSVNQGRRIAEAKQAVIDLYDDGYIMPVKRTDIKVLGRSALGAMHAGINGMRLGNYATAHGTSWWLRL